MILPSILEFLAQRIGLDAHSVGLPSIESAIQERMRERNLVDIGIYRQMLLEEEREQEALIEQVVVSETWFFRDQAPFNFLAVNARRQWGEPSKTAPLRILSLPCSTGEEPYSIAMTLLDAGFPAGTFEIEAVDVSEKALAHARAGIYHKHDFRGKNMDVLQRHFTEDKADVFEVVPAVRQAVRFSHGTLLNPPFIESIATFHAIFCRNLLIYLNASWRQRGVEILKRMIRPDGILFIGHADATASLNTQFFMARDASAFAYYPQKPQPVSAPRKIPTAPLVAKMKPDFSELLRSAQARIDSGDGAGALDHCRAAAEHTRNNAELYHLMGQAHELLGDKELAKDALQKSLYLEPRHLNSLRRLKNLLQSEGDLPAAARIEARIQRNLARS